MQIRREREKRHRREHDARNKPPTLDGDSILPKSRDRTSRDRYYAGASAPRVRLNVEFKPKDWRGPWIKATAHRGQAGGVQGAKIVSGTTKKLTALSNACCRVQSIENSIAYINSTAYPTQGLRAA
jgi:hypothetical protein